MSLSHHSLVGWQRADDLFMTMHRLSREAFPAFERFELGQQLRRAAFSVAVNIAEGFAILVTFRRSVQRSLASR